MLFLLNWYNNCKKSSKPNFDDRLSLKGSNSKIYIILSLNSFISLLASSYSIYSSLSSIFYYFSYFSSANSTFPKSYIILFSLNFSSYRSVLAFSIWSIFLFLKLAFNVLFFLMKQIRNKPSHSKKSMSGSGFFG